MSAGTGQNLHCGSTKSIFTFAHGLLLGVTFIVGVIVGVGVAVCVGVDVIDEKGIKVSKVGITKFVKLDKPVVKKLISSNFGAPTLTMKKDDGEKVWFVKEL